MNTPSITQSMEGVGRDAMLPSARTPQRILITGGTGFIGKPLCQVLLAQGHDLTIMTRRTQRATALFGDHVRCVEGWAQLATHPAYDAVINLAGAPISQRWSTRAKATMVESRVRMTEALVMWMRQAPRPPRVFISGSAIGVYGTDAEHVFTEDTPPVQDAIGAFPRMLCARWEEAARGADALGVRTCLLRTGIVLEKDGGALAQMRLPFCMGLGGPIGDGRQWMSWIHRADLIRLIVHAFVYDGIRGPLNATAPEPVTQAAFSRALGRAMRRPAVLRMPAFQVKLLFGDMGETLLLSGQRVVPHKALESGFHFQHPTIEEALHAIFGKGSLSS